MTASTQSGIRRSDTSAMSRLAFSSCTHRMNQTEVMVNHPKTCGTILRSQLDVRCDRTWMYTWLLGTSGVFLMS